MANISHFRAEIETQNGGATRLGHKWQAVRLNDRNIMVRVSAYGDKGGANQMAFDVARVTGIGSAGASTAPVSRLCLTEQDIADLASGKAKLALVREG
jgi:crotonobetainyl-CoA:carnitine CoA-transferase CaiB-like acyl-CoA transferase